MIAYVRTLLSSPAESARLRREADDLRVQLADKQAEIDGLASALGHWRRLAAALRDVNVDLDTKLHALEDA